jgi:cardiolipin synthase
MNPLEWTLLALITVGAAAAAGHALLSKRDPRAALGWIAVCLMFPAAGPVFYFLFGINRIRTRARKLQLPPGAPPQRFLAAPDATRELTYKDVAADYRQLARISDAITGRPLVRGNSVELLHSGEQAYPSMLAAVGAAERTVYLATYIFESNHTGLRFVDALAAAKARGVRVRVLVDGIGELYSLPRIGAVLRKQAVPAARFLPPRLLPPAVHVNLRNHRKLLVVDGRIGFTGGMNIGDRHLADHGDNPGRVVDAHFRLEGPIVGQMERVFIDDWSFAAGEWLDASVPGDQMCGTAICRSIVDGPDDDMDRLATILIGAAAVAQRRIRIMTPYFLPPPGLYAALQAAALRGVEVLLILPGRNNLPYVQWATRHILGELLRWGVRVYYQPAPFVHTKLFVVDDHYAQIGSANLDPRSLRLNFELGVEVYDTRFAGTLAAHFDEVCGRSTQLGLADLQSLPLLTRVRDATAWLFSPYL